MSAQKVKAKTISNLDTRTPDKTDLFWISKSEGNTYTSYNTTLEGIVNVAEEQISADVRDVFGLSGTNVQELSSRVVDLYSHNVILEGLKTFGTYPVLSGYSTDNEIGNYPDNRFVVRGDVDRLIADSGSFIGNGSNIICDPDNNTPRTAEESPDNPLMIWRIPEGKTDSTQYVDEYGIPDSNGVECARTGQLVVYGWLADNGGVLPQEAWVALYGKIETSTTSTEAKWTILQLQPWPVSSRSKVVQYVGFNIPVKEGLMLKIKTGFKVSASATSTQDGNSLVFPNEQHNVFVGYIVS